MGLHIYIIIFIFTHLKSRMDSNSQVSELFVVIASSVIANQTWLGNPLIILRCYFGGGRQNLTSFGGLWVLRSRKPTCWSACLSVTWPEFFGVGRGPPTIRLSRAFERESGERHAAAPGWYRACKFYKEAKSTSEMLWKNLSHSHKKNWKLIL